MSTHKVGLIGHRFMGKAHSHAWKDVTMFYNEPSKIEMHTICGIGDDLEQAAKQYGWKHYTTDWHSVIANPEIDIIDICTPDDSHCEIALAAANAGKHVICEKPLSIDYQSALKMFKAAEDARVKTLCNFTYRGVPAIAYAKQLINQGVIGTVYAYKGQYLQDFALSPDFPYVWRMNKTVSGPGIFGDKGAHVVDLARYLVGDIAKVCSISNVLIPERFDSATQQQMSVTTSDQAAFMAIFDNTAMGIFELSNMAAGHKNAMLIEINGSKGTLRFDLERMNELVLYVAKGEGSGFKTIMVTEKEHPYINHWWPSGHVLGWADTFVNQIGGFLADIDFNTQTVSNFHDGMMCQRIIDAVTKSDEQRQWVDI